MVRDRIVLGIEDKKLQEKLLKMDSIHIDKIILECRIFEKQKQQIQDVQGFKQNVELVEEKNEDTDGDTENLDYINKQFKGKISNSQAKVNTQKKVCGRCLKFHKFNNCPAMGKTCYKCKKLNHFSIACKSTNLVNVLNQNDN